MCIILLMKYYAYENFKKDTLTLLQQLKPFKPQAVVGIARGGLTLAHAIAEGLDLREVQTLRTELYDDTQKREQISVFNHCEFSKEIQRVVVVDDIADSGDTLKAVMEDLIKKYPAIEFQTATLFYKRTSVYKPSHWVNEATQWIEFFWEKDFS